MSIHNVSFLILGFVGLLLQGIGTALAVEASSDDVYGIAIFLVLLGPVLLASGSAIYAVGKGRKPIFGLLGIISPLGLLFLAILQDQSGDNWMESQNSPSTK